MALLVASACGGGSSDPVGRFAGTWEVDVDRTLVEMQKYEDLAALSRDDQVHHIMKYMGHMKVEVTPGEFTLISKGGPVAMPHELKSSDGDSTVLTVQDRNRTVECTLSAIDGDHMNIRWSAEDTFDIYVWRRAG
jgi:hypothetical protein